MNRTEGGQRHTRTQNTRMNEMAGLKSPFNVRCVRGLFSIPTAKRERNLYANDKKKKSSEIILDRHSLCPSQRNVFGYLLNDVQFEVWHWYSIIIIINSRSLWHIMNDKFALKHDIEDHPLWTEPLNAIFMCIFLSTMLRFATENSKCWKKKHIIENTPRIPNDSTRRPRHSLNGNLWNAEHWLKWPVFFRIYLFT